MTPALLRHAAGDLQLRSHLGRRRARHTSGDAELAASSAPPSSGGGGAKADRETPRRRATSEPNRSRFGPNGSPGNAPSGTATAADREAQGSGAPGESPAGNTRGAGGSRRDASSSGGGEMAAAVSPFAADQHQHPQRPPPAEVMRRGGAEDSVTCRERTEAYLEDEQLDRRRIGVRTRWRHVIAASVIAVQMSAWRALIHLGCWTGAMLSMPNAGPQRQFAADSSACSLSCSGRLLFAAL